MFGMDGAAASRQMPCHCSFFVRHWSVQEGEGQSPDRTWREDQRQALTPAVILFIALLSTEDKSEPG
jgi:hypothetical protein